ncbi:MAG: sigma-70 family RNA polymerase sigma factor [Pseudomonadota bacterium]
MGNGVQNPSGQLALDEEFCERGEVERLYTLHFTPLVRDLRAAFGAGPPDPEDIAQQAFEKLLKRGKLNEISNTKAFLWRVARNSFLTALGRKRTRSKYDFEIEQLYFPRQGDNSSPESVLCVKEELAAINEALRQMPEKRRHAFLLHKVEGMTVVDVAKRLNISRTPAQKHIIRAARDIEVFLRAKSKTGSS